MFTFGLFSTHLPYVLMVAFYAFYFFVLSPSANTPVNLSNSEDKVRIELVQTKVVTGHSAVHYYFAEFHFGGNKKIWRTQDHIRFYTPPDRNPDKEAYNLELFNRPPPVVS